MAERGRRSAHRGPRGRRRHCDDGDLRLESGCDRRLERDQGLAASGSGPCRLRSWGIRHELPEWYRRAVSGVRRLDALGGIEEQCPGAGAREPSRARPALAAADRRPRAAVRSPRWPGELPRSRCHAPPGAGLGHRTADRRDCGNRSLRCRRIHEGAVGADQPGGYPSPGTRLGSRVPGDLHRRHPAQPR